MGNRIRRTVSDGVNPPQVRKYVVDTIGDLPVLLLEIADPEGSGSLAKTYIYAHSQILAQHDGGVGGPLYFYFSDRQGSVRMVVNAAGAVQHLYTYDPFGNVLEHLSAPGAPANPFLYTGQWYDEEIDQYHLRARMYDPAMMRFTARDPAYGKFTEPVTLHKYLYCWNNPTNLVDWNGRSPSGDVLAAMFGRVTLGAIIGANMGAFTGIINQVIDMANGENFDGWEFMTDVLTGTIAGAISGGASAAQMAAKGLTEITVQMIMQDVVAGVLSGVATGSARFIMGEFREFVEGHNPSAMVNRHYMRQAAIGIMCETWF